MLTLLAAKDLLVFQSLNPTSLCLLAAKLLMGYFGQLCHCMSHTPKNLRPHWVIALQDAGLMLSSREHMIHHHKYDDNFCIGSGIFNPLLKFLIANASSNKWAWLAIFLSMGVFDVYVLNRSLCALFLLE